MGKDGHDTKPIIFGHFKFHFHSILYSANISDETVWDFEFGIGIFRPKYRGIGIGIEIGMKSVWIRYEIGIGIGIKLALIWNLMQFVACSCVYNIAIEPKIGRKSVSNDLEPILKLKSVPSIKENNNKKFILNTEFGFGIGSKSIRYRYTDPINRYTESLVFMFQCNASYR